MKTNQPKRQRNSNRIFGIAECSRERWPFQRHSAAWLSMITLCLLGCVLTARGQDPRITNPNNPVDTNVSVGATVSFVVSATSTNGPMTRQWYQNGTNLPGATNVTLVITNVTVAHAGGYMATIMNAIGGVTNSRTATCIVDPTFTKIMIGAIVTDVEATVSGSWADYDNDDNLDVFVGNVLNSGTARNTLYHNSGGTNYYNNGATNFTRVSASPFTTDFLDIWAAAWGDYDNDGNVDLIAAGLDGGLTAQRLYRNNGNGSFTAVVDTGLRSDANASTTPWWIDYNNDGFLDLFVAKGAYYSSVANDCLFRNNGDGTFKKMTAAEVGPMLNDQLHTDWCISADYDNDGRQELSVNQSFPIGGGITYYTNFTWRYQADGTFQPTMPIGLIGIPQWWGDYDNDGWLDAFSVEWDGYTAPTRLFRNLGTNGFTNVTTRLNHTAPGNLNWPAWGDYDNDGWLDMFFTTWSASTPSPPNGLLHNNRDGTFTQILSGSPVSDAGRRSTVSWADYDNDGFLDLFVAMGNGEAERNLLYRNNGNTNHWLKVKLDGRASNRSGIHAKVRAQATINGQTFWQMREITCGNGYAGQNGLLAHFGLGDATNVTTLRIEWPSGIVQELQNVTNNQFLTVVESQDYVGSSPQFGAVTSIAGGLQLSFDEPLTNARYILEASTDLVKWTKLMARTSNGGTAQFTDTRTTNYTSRFYRLQVP